MKKNQSGVDTMMKKIYRGDASHTWQCDSVVRTTIKASEEGQNLTHRHPKTP